MLGELPEGTVTVLFTDVEGSTDLRTSRGDDIAHALLRTQGELVRSEVKDHGGHEVKTMGDGFMIAFASARAAVDCAVAIQRRLDEQNHSRASEDEIRVRMGLNTGEVIREDGDLFGEAVNAAARIMAKANGGQILVSETVRGVLGHGHDTELVDRGRFRMKGFPERWRLYEVVWRQEAAPVAAPLPAERTPFVGREAERAELRGYLDRAAAGRGGLIMVGGEPGVGKTRLTEELLAEAPGRDMFALSGRCYEMEGSLPYMPFVEMVEAATRMFPATALRAVLGDLAPEVAKLIPDLRHHFPDIPPPLELPLEQERRYLFNALREFIRRAGLVQPMLLILDDLHWADDSTLLLLQHIAQELAEMRVIIVATYRDVEIEAGRPLTRALEVLLRQRLAHKMTLKRLSGVDVAAMLHAISGQQPPPALAEVIYGETDGNPFFVEEVFRHLAEEGKLFTADGRWRSDLHVSELEVPETVRLVIGRRLDRVSEDCRRVLTTAAIIGRAFSFALLEALSDLPEEALLDAIDEAERAQIIVATTEGLEDRFAFVHELIRQTLLSDISAPRRQRLHLQVAEAMERLYGPVAEDHASDLTYHLYEAGNAADPRKTARYLALAGERALGAVALEEALRLYDSALALHTPADRRERADLLFKRGLTVRSLGDLEEALRNWREALVGYEQLGDREAASQVYATVCQELWWSLRFEEALDFSLRGLAGLGKRVTPERCLLLAVGGVTLSLGGFYGLAERMIGQSMALAEELGDPHLLGRVLAHKAFHHLGYAQVVDLVQAGERAAPLLRAAGNLSDLLDTLWVTSSGLAFLGRFDEALRLGKEVEPLANQLNHAGALMVERRVINGRALMLEGNLDRYGQFARDDLEFCRSSGLTGFNSFSEIGLTRFWKGDWPGALESFQEAVRLEHPGALSGVDWCYLFLMRAYMGDKEGALAMLGDKKSLVPSSDLTLGQRLPVMLRLIKASRACGYGPIGLLRDACRVRMMKMEQHLPRSGQANTLGSWMMLTAVVEGLIVLGEQKRAAKFYGIVAEGMTRTGAVMRYMFDRLLVTILAMLAAAAGRWAEAEEHFRTALRRAEELPHVIEQPEVRRFYARMLIDRNGPGDRETARRLLTEAVEMYRRIGMPKHMNMAELMLAETGAPHSSPLSMP